MFDNRIGGAEQSEEDQAERQRHDPDHDRVKPDAPSSEPSGHSAPTEEIAGEAEGCGKQEQAELAGDAGETGPQPACQRQRQHRQRHDRDKDR